MTDLGYQQKIRRFYDDLAPEYDLMTDIHNRLERDAHVFDDLARKFSIGRALDAGCGTGFHSILLARAGVRVTAIDLSIVMVRHAVENAARCGVSIDVQQASISDLGRWMHSQGAARPDGERDPFDALFCLGNTLAHLPDDATLDETLGNFRMVVRPGGVLIVQILNYEKILARREKVLNVRKVGPTTFERKYSYGKDNITFTISKTDAERSRSGSVTLRPLTRATLLNALGRCGFQKIESFGNLTFAPYLAEDSTDLVVVATT